MKPQHPARPTRKPHAFLRIPHLLFDSGWPLISLNCCQLSAARLFAPRKFHRDRSSTSLNSFVCRSYAHSPSNSFPCRSYAFRPGCTGPRLLPFSSFALRFLREIVCFQQRAHSLYQESASLPFFSSTYTLFCKIPGGTPAHFTFPRTLDSSELKVFTWLRIAEDNGLFRGTRRYPMSSHYD